jgi:hypothetical protein
MITPPVACTLSPEQLRCESAALLPGLSIRAERGEWRQDGVCLWFLATSENLDAIVRTVDEERRCCAFLNFRLDVPASGEPVSLELTGPPGTVDFLAGLGLRFAGRIDIE